jgi:hypothetical protein
MPESWRATKWKGVSYIGNIALIARNCLPPVQSPVPLQPSRAAPMVTNPICASPASISRMFSLGPAVSRIETAMPSSRVSMRASPAP